MYDNNQPKKQYETKPLEGVLWLEEQQFKAKDGRDFTVCKGKLKDVNGEEFYIDAYKNWTKNGKPYFSIKLKSVVEANMERDARRAAAGYYPPPNNDIRIENIPF